MGAPDLIPLAEYEIAAEEIIAPFRSTFSATWFHEAGAKPPRREWLIKDLILAKSFGIIYGPPASGKSFLLADMMLTCAANAIGANEAEAGDWFGYKTNPFGVIYLVAEGADDFIIRLHAWRIEKGIAPDVALPFVFLPSSVDLRSDTADTERLIKEISGLDRQMREKCGIGAGALVIDTVARAMAGGNENDSSVMGAFVGNCERIGRELGIAVIGVHHGGKEAGKGPRGHESLLGACDFVFEVQPPEEDQTYRKWFVRKFKAGKGGSYHNFHLEPVAVDIDEDGDQITSCIVIPKMKESAEPRDRRFKPKASELDLLRVLSDAVSQYGVSPPYGDQAIRGISAHVFTVVKSADVSRLYRERFAGAESGTEAEVEAALKARWRRCIQSLIRARVIGSASPYLWFTGEKIRGVQIKGVHEPAPINVAGGGDD